MLYTDTLKGIMKEDPYTGVGYKRYLWKLIFLQDVQRTPQGQ